MKQYPPIQVVNRADEPIGGASLKEVYQGGLLHRIVYILCEDRAGQLLLQKRGPTVATYPNCWDVSAAGHVDEGEAYETAAMRELQEELGLSNLKLQTVDSYYEETSVGEYTLNRFCKVYKVILPAKVRLHPDPAEVVDTRWLTIQAAKEFIAGHPDEVALGLVACMERYYRHENNKH